MKIINEVLEFFNTKGLYNKSTADKQFYKLSEEVGELGRELLDNEPDKAKIELGDVIIVCINMAKMMNTDIEDCITLAHNKNINRTGKMVGSNYIKTEDLK